MNDLEKIQEIERILGFSLHNVEYHNISTDHIFYFNSLSEFYFTTNRNPEHTNKGTRNYCLDQEGNLMGICLNYCPVYLLPPQLLASFKKCRFISLKNSFLFDYSFIQEFKQLETINLSNNNLTDVSFLKELIGITSLDLSYNKVTDVAFLKELKGLTSLDLSYNKVTDISFLKELDKLTSLDLSHNSVKDFSIIKELKNIISLEISVNELTNVSFVKELKRIISLKLSGNKIQDISFLKELKGLTSLDLSDNNISDFSVLKELRSLTSLDLNTNDIIDVSFLDDLREITSLSLSDNNITIINLKELKRLASIDLSFNKIADISFIQDLNKLTTLNLSANKIDDFTSLKDLKGLVSLGLNFNNITEVSFLKKLKGLTSLKLKTNKIKDISLLKNLKELTSLDLSDNDIYDFSDLKELRGLTMLNLNVNNIADVSFLKELKSLISLSLGGNILTDVLFLKDLNGLISLNLNSNKISDISVLKELKGLISLNLNNNNITDVSVLKDLKGLTFLDLSGNNLFDVSFLKELKGLTLIDLGTNHLSDVFFLKELNRFSNCTLSYNEIKEIPFWLSETPLEIIFNNKNDSNCINLYGNPLEKPPLEYIERGKESIKNWFKDTVIDFNEIKILLVGEAKAGKTSLLRRLIKDEFNTREDQTEGIIIETLDFAKLQTFKNHPRLHGIKAHVWDFGGQEIMSSTHEFFLTNRSIYLLVLEARKDAKTDMQVRDWLKRIEAFGGNSPVIVVTNKIELNEAFGLDKYELKHAFPQIKGFVDVSCSTNFNLDKLKIILEEVIPLAELFQTKIDKHWFPVKNKLQEITGKKQYIVEREFDEICQIYGVQVTSEQMALIGFLNDLGMVLHFSELRMSEYFILDPYWITTGVYRIITSDFVAQKKGEILFSDLNYIVNKEQRKIQSNITEKQKELKYSSNDLCYLSEIMSLFKLSYFSENREKMLIPDLLDKETPGEEVKIFNENKDILSLLYQFDYLPISILHFFMVEMNKDIRKAWRTGVILQSMENYETQALVTASENKINISVLGNYRNKSDYLSIIRFFLDRFIDKYNLKAEMYIPLHNNSFVKYKILVMMEQEDKKEYKDWETGIEYNISHLLTGILKKEIIQQQAQTINNIYIAGDANTFLQNIVINDINVDIIGKSKEEIITILLTYLSNQFEKLHSRHDRHDYDLEQIAKYAGQIIEENVKHQLSENSWNTLEHIRNDLIVTQEEAALSVLNELLDWIDVAEQNLSKQLNEAYKDLKKSNDWKLKLTFALPLLSVIGINVELKHEMKLNNIINNIGTRIKQLINNN
jgi:internalin A